MGHPSSCQSAPLTTSRHNCWCRQSTTWIRCSQGKHRTPAGSSSSLDPCSSRGWVLRWCIFPGSTSGRDPARTCRQWCPNACWQTCLWDRWSHRFVGYKPLAFSKSSNHSFAVHSLVGRGWHSRATGHCHRQGYPLPSLLVDIATELIAVRWISFNIHHDIPISNTIRIQGFSRMAGTSLSKGIAGAVSTLKFFLTMWKIVLSSISGIRTRCTSGFCAGPSRCPCPSPTCQRDGACCSLALSP